MLRPHGPGSSELTPVAGTGHGLTDIRRLTARTGKAAGIGAFLLLSMALFRMAAGTTAPPVLAAGSNWWSLQPLVRPSIPVAPSSFNQPRNPIDAFIDARLLGKGLVPAPRSDRRTLIRRLYFDLTGLPPTPSEISAFLSDPDPQAYERLVDRLLASPHYGERWARHWLDVVHFGETHGYDKDQPRPNAWPYRDYVIRSLNQDKPYARFVQEQVAGDVLFPGTQDGFEALGFIAAGPWDLIGHAEVPETKTDGKVARHLDRDDMVVNTIQTFSSLTVQCAQCHNHKFDPISQEDYYSLQAVFAAVDRADKRYDTAPDVARLRQELEARKSGAMSQKRNLEEAIRARAGQPLIDLDKRIAALPKAGAEGEAIGYHSAIENQQNSVKWIQVDLGHARKLGRIVLHACKDDFAGIGEGFGFPMRYKVEVSDDVEFKNAVSIVADHTDNDVPNPRLRPQEVDAGGREARYIRVTATKLAPRQNDFIFALSELRALDAGGTNVAFGAVVSCLDSIEAPVRWRKSNLTDGWYSGIDASENQILVGLQREQAQWIAASTTDGESKELVELEQSLASVQRDLAALPPQRTAYVAAIHHGSGNFTGTGSNGGKPRPIYLLNRGNILKPGTEVSPGTLSCLPGLSSRFELPSEHREGDRRAALARWLTRPDNPLTWRSIVNRVWQYHFGRGLVETPNDFGRMGALPSHPELLEWLAIEFRDGGQSLKTLHKLILMSDAYQRSSEVHNAGREMAVDSDNQFLWRQNRRKLEAEAVRDSLLAVSDSLDLTMGGPSFQDFVVEHPEHSPHYEYHLHDPEDPKAHRRSIYRFIVRSQQQPFMTVLDCADPSMQVGKRNEGQSPLQALSLLNNALVLSLSKHFAEHLQAGGGDLADQVRRGHLAAVGRVPNADEEAELVGYARQFGLANYCRVVMNLNEFTFVD